MPNLCKNTAHYFISEEATASSRSKRALMKVSGKTFDLEAIRLVIIRLFPTGQPTLARVTNALGVSPRTLQRRLADNGLSFSQLADETRFLSARQLITQGRKLSDVAGELGYADAGSFTRAFQRWTGLTPLKYRKQFGGASTNADKK
ncbi:MAG: helix-turn-helix transcriptional regulator [Gammaproteobacteria bacterium]|nr:helix-turn-helix transcriptional regulator [Gammaproteobacteria bacterium]